MKCLWIALLVAVVVSASCSSSVRLDKNGLPLPDPKLAAQAGITVNQMGDGYWVFSRKCVECHGVLLPEGPLTGQWHPVLQSRTGNVGLSLRDESALLNYIRATRFRK